MPIKWDLPKIEDFDKAIKELDNDPNSVGDKLLIHIDDLSYFNSLKNGYKFAKPDIYIPDENLIIEIKATNTLNKQEMLDKKKAYLENGYSFKLILDKKEVDF